MKSISITLFWTMNSTKKDVGLAAITFQLNGRNGMASSAINARIVKFSLRFQTLLLVNQIGFFSHRTRKMYNKKPPNFWEVMFLGKPYCWQVAPQHCPFPLQVCNTKIMQLSIKVTNHFWHHYQKVWLTEGLQLAKRD